MHGQSEQPSAHLVHKCEDTCPTARNSICDEGRRDPDEDSETEVLCDVGTDCSDCGPFRGYLPPREEWNGTAGPIAFLKQSLDQLRTRLTLTRPPFQMLYTDPAKDQDLSAHLYEYGMLEGGITEVFRMVLQDKCVDPQTGRRRLVLDVGANFGYFSAYAAMLGCRVIAWEPVPHFYAFAQHVLAVNNVSHLVTLRRRVVGERQGDTVNIQVPTRGAWGTASVAGLNRPVAGGHVTTAAQVERLDAVVHEDVLLMKVDVEGFEPYVLESASGLLASHTIHNIIMEYNAGECVGENAKRYAPEFGELVEHNPRMLLGLLDRGYKIGLMLDRVAKAGLYTPDNPFPALPEVTRGNLQYDLQVASAIYKINQAQAISQPPPQDAEQLLNCHARQLFPPGHKAWGCCTCMPYAAHPKGLRSHFKYNTNLWATLQHDLMKVEGTAGMLDGHVDASQQYFLPGPMGLGYLPCASRPVAELVRLRCPCKWAEGRSPPAAHADIDACRAEEALVLQLMARGKLTYAA